MVFVVGSREMSICTVVESFSTCERESIGWEEWLEVLRRVLCMSLLACEESTSK